MTAHVSVLMAAYNAGRFIDRALESLVRQTYQDWELVAVDDGSSDDTSERLATWCQRDCRIRLLRNPCNLGIGATRKRALDDARGEYAAVLDSDDEALPDWLKSRVDWLDGNPGVVAVSGSRIVIDDEGRVQRTIQETKSALLMRWQLLFGNPFNQPSCMFRVAAARQVGGYLAEPYLEDWSLFARLLAVGDVVQTGAPLVRYRIHARNTSLTAGANRSRLELVATSIMRRAVTEGTGLEVPENLVWYLFRGRFAFAGERRDCKRAVEFVFDAFQAFLGRHDAGPAAPEVAAAVVEDARQILLSGGWTPGVAFAVAAKAMRIGGVRASFSREFLFSSTKTLALPLSALRRRQREQSGGAQG